MHMPEGNNQIKVWLDIVEQISFFFNETSSFSTCMAKAICAALSFRKCYWTVKDINMLLYSIKAYVEVAILARNCCKKSFNLINQE